MAYLVKGSTLKSKLIYVDERFGAAARERLEGTLQKKAEIYPLLTGAWYPFELFVSLLESIAQNHFSGDLERLEDLGVHSARNTLGQVYKAFVREEDFVGFLNDHARLHQMFYSQGVSVVKVHDDSLGADIKLSDKPIISVADLHVGAGFYREAAVMHGLSRVTCAFSHTHNSAHFVINWS